MRITSWNVNSLKARLAHVLDYCRAGKTDCLLLQELKLSDEAFPHDAFSEIGWHSVCHGQKTYNGVAIIAAHPIEDATPTLPTIDISSIDMKDTKDEQARYLEARVNGFRLACIYLPNGNPCPGDKFEYKLNWMARLYYRAQQLYQAEEPVIIAGDYNVIPQAIDCYDPDNWLNDALYHPQSRAAFFRLINMGWCDAIRAIHPQGAQYSYWDYQGGAWQRDNGIRIDHILLSPEAANRLQNAGIDKMPRGLDRPSDHTPVWAEFTSIRTI